MGEPPPGEKVGEGKLPPGPSVGEGKPPPGPSVGEGKPPPGLGVGDGRPPPGAEVGEGRPPPSGVGEGVGTSRQIMSPPIITQASLVGLDGEAGMGTGVGSKVGSGLGKQKKSPPTITHMRSSSI